MTGVGGSGLASEGERHRKTERERENERDRGEREIKDVTWRKEQPRRESERGV